MGLRVFGIPTSSAPTGAIVGTTDPQTLTNKRITRRSTTVSQPGATPSINADNFDHVEYTGVNAAITSITVTGTPAGPADRLVIAFTDDGTGRALTFGGNFEALSIAAPTTTVSSRRLVTGWSWNPATSKWSLVGWA